MDADLREIYDESTHCDAEALEQLQVFGSNVCDMINRWQHVRDGLMGNIRTAYRLFDAKMVKIDQKREKVMEDRAEQVRGQDFYQSYDWRTTTSNLYANEEKRALQRLHEDVQFF
jgi:hypothetical protein